jgi:hypothetical protein
MALIACRSSSAPRADADSGPPLEANALPGASLRAQSVPASTARAASTADAATDGVPSHDFEDQFLYGEDDAGRHANVADAAALTNGVTRYRSYLNARFAFALDVPFALEPMPEPENGDGQQWRLGKLVAMTASGMYWDLGMSDVCASSSHVTFHKESQSSCMATGRNNGFVFWERGVLAHGVLYTLRFQYAESLKTAMDPVVAHVNASWRF